MSLAAVRSIGAARASSSPDELEDFEQELIDQYLLAQVGAGISDKHIEQGRSTTFEFTRFLMRPLWTARSGDADRFLAYLRRERANSKATVVNKADSLAQLFGFLIDRYQAEIHAVTGHVIEQVIDEHNRPLRAKHVAARIPPSCEEVAALFGAWGPATVEFRKYLPAARNYMAASLWQRVGLRINETIMLDIRDWRPDLGEHGKLHVRFGKGSRGRGHKPRLVPAINSVDRLMTWWLSDVRHQFGDDWTNPDAPLLPSERRDANGRCTRIGDDALRSGLIDAVTRWLPTWSGRLTPHGLRHYCASSLYGRGMDLKAIQELLGHTWLSTTTRYVHVHADCIERAWAQANDRVTARLEGKG